MFENWTDERVDGLLRDLAEAFAHAAENLAIAAVEETGLGNVHDKTLKKSACYAGRRRPHFVTSVAFVVHTRGS